MARASVAWIETAFLFAALYVGVPIAGLGTDRALGWPAFPDVVRFVGVALVVLGATGIARCVFLLVRVGRGTPNPARPTKVLVTTGPYAWTRNPVMLSHFAAALGVACLVASLGAVLIVFALVPPSYVIARIEERGLEGRFGEAYRAYRLAVPRFVPRPPGRHRR